MPKLPADLPENWTRGQIVSPNGTETGLTEQHGYNYLMKQVNDTQTEVNGINEALQDVAQQTTVNEIKNKIGTESDADTQPTLFGRLAQLKNVMVEKLTELLTKVTGIDTKIGTSSDSSDTDTLFGKIQAVKESTAAKRYFFSETVQETKDGYDFTDSIRSNENEPMSIILVSKVAEYDGTIGFKTTFNFKGNNGNDYLAIAAYTPSTLRGGGSGRLLNLEQTFFKPERTVFGPEGYNDPYIPFVDSSNNYIGNMNLKFDSSYGKLNDDVTITVNCKKGEKIILLAMAKCGNASSMTACIIGQVKVQYDIK